jgi:hypothetical protein
MLTLLGYAPYVFGGYNGLHTFDTVYTCCNETGVWTTSGTRMPRALYYHKAVGMPANNTQALVCAGLTDADVRSNYAWHRHCS